MPMPDYNGIKKWQIALDNAITVTSRSMPMRSASLNIDGFGRLVIPKAVRDRLGLTPGTTVRIEEAQGGLVIRPARDEPQVTRVNGVLVLTTPAVSPVEDGVRADRAARTSHLARRADEGRQ